LRSRVVGEHEPAPRILHGDRFCDAAEDQLELSARRSLVRLRLPVGSGSAEDVYETSGCHEVGGRKGDADGP
jgi:hypothetical protein